MSTVPRRCGLCKRSPRENDAMLHPVRVTAEDLAKARPQLDAGAHTAEPGLYQMCEDCKKAVEPVVDERLVAEGTVKDKTAVTPHHRQ